ncbi:MAG: nitrile hydratase [Pseudomonadota bacterium]
MWVGSDQLTRRKNDIGGAHSDPIDRTETPVKHWEMESDALRKVLGDPKRQLVSLDELRRAMEDLPQEAYDAGFFSRRISAMAEILIEKGVLTREELNQRIQALSSEAQ